MNLRKFHVVFIACSIGLAVLFGDWALRSSQLEGTARIATGVGAFALALALLVWEAWFLRSTGRSR